MLIPSMTVGELKNVLRYYDDSLPVYIDGAELVDTGEVFVNKKSHDAGDAPTALVLTSDTTPFGPCHEEIVDDGEEAA